MTLPGYLTSDGSVPLRAWVADFDRYFAGDIMDIFSPRKVLYKTFRHLDIYIYQITLVLKLVWDESCLSPSR